MTGHIEVETLSGIGVVTFNRPQQLNAFTQAMLMDISQALRELEANPETRVVVLRGKGRAFSTGADLNELRDADPESVRRSNRHWIDLFALIERLELPVIASVSGYAIAGGTELSLACDFVIAGESSRFGLSEMRVGVIPGAGACVRLTRWVGRAWAKELLMLGDDISAEEALRIGLISRMVPDDDLPRATLALASRLASRSPSALAAAKRAVNIGSELDLDRGIEYVLGEFAALFGGDGQREGMAAFLEKRPPQFTRTTKAN